MAFLSPQLYPRNDAVHCSLCDKQRCKLANMLDASAKGPACNFLHTQIMGCGLCIDYILFQRFPLI